jgi:hypothetical protein
MKFIEVSSDWDYGALKFEDSGWDTPKGRKELFDLAMRNGGSAVLVLPGDPEEKMEDVEIDIRALSYGPIDKDFFLYMMDELVDRDMLQYVNIYIVEE